MSENPAPKPDVDLVLVMGVSGSGKTTAVRLLAQLLDAPFVEADDLHAPEDVARMKSGVPLTDALRAPWLERVNKAAHALGLQSGGPVVVACSALKRKYRTALLAGFRHPFIAHLDGPPHLLRDRMAKRKGHFMPASLLESQVATLEPLAPEEPGRTFPLADPPEKTALAILAAIGAGPGAPGTAGATGSGSDTSGSGSSR